MCDDTRYQRSNISAGRMKVNTVNNMATSSISARKTTTTGLVPKSNQDK